MTGRPLQYRHVMPRRTLLRGAGGVSVALPFLDAMHTTSVFAKPAEAPIRAFNVFFGLGLPRELQAEGFDGPLEPLQAFRDKLLILRGVDHDRSQWKEGCAHTVGARAAFNAGAGQTRRPAGGATLDQVLRTASYPFGQPAGVLPTLLMGTYFRRDRAARFAHCWTEQGAPADVPSDRPEVLFKRLFGALPGPDESDDPATVRRKRYERSVLDAVVAQYRYYRSDGSNLDPRSQRRLANHLERIREVEKRVFDPTDVIVDGGLPRGTAADPDGQGVDVAVCSLVREWRLMADLFALGVHCDQVRFGGATFLSAGERIRLKGEYRNNGQLLHRFDDALVLRDHGADGCGHEFWHLYDPTGRNRHLRAHIRLILGEVAYLLARLDDPAYPDENGKTVLDNALVSISTEAGDGRHGQGHNELNGVFHAFSAAAGRVRVGQLIDVHADALDVYNTVLTRAYNLKRGLLGPPGRPLREVTALLPG